MSLSFTTNPTTRAALIALGLFCVPTAALLGVRAMAPIAKPKSASAQTAAPAPDAPDVGQGMHLAERDAKLMKTFDELESNAKDRLAVGIVPAVPTAKATEKTGPVVAELPSTITLSSVMKSGGVAVAAIQGKLYRQGDRIAPEWTVTAIDDKTGSVTLQHNSGSQRVLTMKVRDGR